MPYTTTPTIRILRNSLRMTTQQEAPGASHCVERFVADFRRPGVAAAEAAEIAATKAEISRTIAEDAACRFPGVTEGLYGVADLAPFARLGHGAPTIRRRMPTGRPAAGFGDRAQSDGKFARRFRESAPFLAGFDLQAHGFVLAGGAASCFLMRRPTNDSNFPEFQDYDLFLVGHADDEAALAAIAALGDRLVGYWGAVEVYRTAGCVTFCAGDDHDRDGSHDGVGAIVQVILRRYRTIGEVIHGFDLGSSAVAWDGQRVHLTAMGLFAANHGANVVNLAPRRSSYEARLARYFMRGFDLVLPDLLGSNFVALGGRLPYLYAEQLLADGCSCHLTANALYSTRPGWDNTGCHRDGLGGAEAPGGGAEAPDGAAETSEYAVGHVSYGDRRAIFLRNARAATRETPHVAALCARARYTPGLDVRTIEPEFDVDLLARQTRRAFSGVDGVKIGALVSLLGARRAETLILAAVRNGGARPSPEALADACADRIRELEARPHTIPFRFMGVEDGTALVGPYPRAGVSPAEWYGAAFRPAA
jgi:hypothetical protein